ncbi:glycoside hydrolase family 97 protein [Xylanibacter ruminicola]|uniref:Alpha-glucosidase family protein n=1 Tax=Xylanibacter ruminicola (strain ATCC 19189 / DSM 19721 / CIP 105475 / JCM 8958 / 23) TaxID=264731 RepID=D5EVI3_XYLR2|nr:glycoside hydrolase family 97 protein [Xylanibacter ruminicola]ADE82389.1 alpha-glucosidase family protein [Xylanibacter ruminicola 23]SEH93708.1 Glycosyl-hydrolase 97 C-terminal, oligomerisation [Xylanibacter ruminicola]
MLASSVLCWADDVRVSSPNGSLVVTVSDAEGKLSYTATLDGKQMLAPSALGLQTSLGDLTKELSIVNSQLSTVANSYSMRGTKASKVDYKANALTINLQNKDGVKFSILFQVSDNDIAYRYQMPRQTIRRREYKRVRILSEVSGFNFPEGTTTFISPQIGPETGWEQTKPSYEEGYSNDAPMDKASQYGHGYIFPALFHLPTGWALVSETGVTSGYCGSHLSDYLAGSGYTVAYPDKGENNGFGTDFAAIPLPGETPWRTITLGSTLKPILETTISYDVVETRYQASTDYKAGRYTWSWLIGQDNSINYDDQVRFIDLASAMGFEYCLVDNWWDQNIGRERIAELSKYAQSKGVHLLMWYNSNGFWNDAPQTPRNCMNTAVAREKEMSWLESIGVKGIKVDFFGGDKQQTMQLYEDILSDANRHGLQVVFHGCTVPRGWERMYPNFVASEAVLASENLFFGEGATISEGFDLTLHPFCRNATASMDWGGIIMNKFMSTDNKSRHSRKTTDIFELASGITMQTSVQCVAMQPNNLQELPQFEMDFLRELPTTWEETRFIDGYPGKYVVMARKATNGKWYIAGLNAQKEPLALTLDLKAFGDLTKLLVDDKQMQPVQTALKKDKKGKIKVVIQPNGGMIIK